MAYAAGHRDQVKGKIVDSARRLFNRHGFDSVSVDQIMAGAGLTRGGFYSYFDSKSDLYAEVLGCFFTDPDWKNCWEGVEVDIASSQAAPQVVRAYLSQQHFDDVENSCPMVALPGDVMRSDGRAKLASLRLFFPGGPDADAAEFDALAGWAVVFCGRRRSGRSSRRGVRRLCRA
jgi:TetR/AcrR family transcriptional repressor of nem operon